MKTNTEQEYFNMSKTKFDEIIKDLSGYDKNMFGYKIREKTYCNYLTEDEWKNFKKEMKEKYPKAYEQYSNGNGGELKYNKKSPPKMACIASSSRFTYLTFRDSYIEVLRMLGCDIKGNGVFSFETELPIPCKRGTPPSLDASYIEAKCHEVFYTYKLEWADNYFQDGLFLGKEKQSLQLCNNNYNNNTITRETFNLDNQALYLDIKQFVCHLLGIANDNNKNRELIYLFFKPDDNSLNTYKNRYERLEEQFNNFANCECIQNFCKRNNITLKFAYATNKEMGEKTNIVVKYIITP